MVSFYDPLAEPLEMLIKASQARIGVAVFTDNVELLKARLYKAKSKFSVDYPEIVGLSIRTSTEDPTSQVWIAKSNIKEALTNGQDRSQGNTHELERRETEVQVHGDTTQDPSTGD